MAKQNKKAVEPLVNQVEWDTVSGDLVVNWSSGQFARYSGVPQSIAHTVMNSASIAAAVGQYIEGKYPRLYE